MKINELIKILENLPDKEKEVYFESLGNYWTTNVDFSIDDENNVSIYEVAKEVSK